jgi:hypothetical protein
MKRDWNISIWLGFLLTLGAFVSYLTLFYRFPVTRDFPWVNLLLFALAGYLLVTGVRRAFRQPDLFRGRISGPILSALAVAVFSLFAYYIFHFSKQIPPSTGAPRVGSKAPGFTLPDADGKAVSLSDLLKPAAGSNRSSVLLVFYRGYW